MITDWNEPHEVLLPIDHNHYNFRKTKSVIWKIALIAVSFMLRTISRKKMEKSFKSGFKQPLEKAIALKSKLLSCYSDCESMLWLVDLAEST